MLRILFVLAIAGFVLSGCGLQRSMQKLSTAMTGGPSASVSADLGQRAATFQLVRISPEGETTVIRRWGHFVSGKRVKQPSPIKMQAGMRYLISGEIPGRSYVGSKEVTLVPNEARHHDLVVRKMEDCERVAATKMAFGSAYYWVCPDTL